MDEQKTAYRRTVLKTIGAFGASSAILSGTVGAAPGGLKRELAEVRSATAQYNDPANAVADGYIPEDEAVCGMGYHYPHEDLVAAIMALQNGDHTELAEYLGSIDRTEPHVIVYGEDDGDLVLGAVEYLTLDNSTDLFTSTEKDHWHPFVGQTYALHAWVHIPNPEGVFHPANPRHLFTHPEWCEQDGEND